MVVICASLLRMVQKRYVNTRISFLNDLSIHAESHTLVVPTQFQPFSYNIYMSPPIPSQDVRERLQKVPIKGLNEVWFILLYSRS